VVKATAGFEGVEAEDEAVIVTRPPDGIEAGAVYTVVPKLAVCVGLKLPQAPVLPQLAVQSTPRLFVSPATFAASVAWDTVVNVVGGAVEVVTTIGVVEVTYAVTRAVIAGFVVEAAVMVTAPPLEGAVEGLTKLTATPLAVCAVFDPFNVPQLEALQLRDQSTPAAAESLVTIAVNGVE
jgi:hypothetical protein